MGPIKYSALRAKASPRQVAAWRESVLRSNDHPGVADSDTIPRHRLKASTWVVVVGVLALVSGLVSVGAGILEVTDRAATGTLSVVATVATLALGVGWVLLQTHVRQLAEGWRDTYRLMSFAADNGFHAVPVATPADLPGRIFHRGLDEHRVRLDVVAWVQGGRQCHVATECWSTGEPEGGGAPIDEGSSRYLAVKIGEEPLPRTHFFPNAPAESADAQAGPDPRLRVAAGTEHWAQALFTDRLTKVLTHSKQPRDAEIVEEWFIAYDLSDIDPLSASAWERTFQLVAALPAFPVAPPTPETEAALAQELAAQPAGSKSKTAWATKLWRRPTAQVATGH